MNNQSRAVVSSQWHTVIRNTNCPLWYTLHHTRTTSHQLELGLQADGGLLDSSGGSNGSEIAELLQTLPSSILLQGGSAEHGYGCSHTSALEDTGDVVPGGGGGEGV